MEEKDLDVEQSVSDMVSFGFGVIRVNGEVTEDPRKIQDALYELLALQGFFFFYLS